jgi:hypothetical protein
MYMMPPMARTHFSPPNTTDTIDIQAKNNQAPEYAKKPFSSKSKKRKNNAADDTEVSYCCHRPLSYHHLQMHPASPSTCINHPAQRPRPYSQNNE